MCYLLLAALVITAVLFAALWIIYSMAFASKRSRHPAADEMPTMNSQYAPYAAALYDNVQKLAKVPYEAVEITSHDRLKLRGRFYDAGKEAPVVIIFHGYRSAALRDASGGAPFSFAKGYSVLLPDQRAHGLSEGRTITFGVKERRDCLEWVKYIINRQGRDVRILIMGVSMGAATVLMASDLQLPENVKGIAADCPFSSPEEIILKVASGMGLPAGILKPFIRMSAAVCAGFRLNESTAENAVKDVKIPVLMIHGDDDRFVPCEMSRKIRDANPEMCTLVEVEGAGHGIAYYVNREKYENALTSMCEKVFGGDNA